MIPEYDMDKRKGLNMTCEGDDGRPERVGAKTRPSATPRDDRLRAPPDDRTQQEVDEDDQAEAQHWQDRIDEVYDAARDHTNEGEPPLRAGGWRNFFRERLRLVLDSLSRR